MSEPATGRPPLPAHILAAQNADVLRCIGAQDAPQTAAQIAAATGKDKSNTRKTLERLAEAGLIQKDWAGLTAEGHTILPRLDVLEGEGPAPRSPAGEARVTWAQIQPSALNPRTDFDDPEVQAGIHALADSIEARGLKQPIRVKPTTVTDQGLQFYEIIDGERRWRAIGLLVEAGYWPADREVDAVIDHYLESDTDQLLDAMVANLQRADLNPIDEAAGYQALVTAGLSTEDIARQVGRSRRHIQQRVQLLKLDEEALDQVRRGEIGVKDALARVQDARPAQAPEAAPNQPPSGEEGADGVDNTAAPSEPCALDATGDDNRGRIDRAVADGADRRVQREAFRDEGTQRDFVHNGAQQASAARQASFSAGGVLEHKAEVAPAAFADALPPDQRLLMAEIAWVWRHAGRMVSLPDGRMGRAIPAAGADSHPATLNLIHGARLPAKALAHWYAPGEGPLLTFTEPGRQALRHFAAALGNLDASDEAALDDLQAVRRLAGATADVCNLMADHNQVAAPWLNAVLQEAPATSPRREAEIDANDVADAEEAAHADAAAWAARAMAERDAELAQPSYSYTASEVRQMLAEAFFRGRRGVERELMENTQACRVCACTEDGACQPPCAWVESEIVALCTACAPYAAKAASQSEQEPA